MNRSISLATHCTVLVAVTLYIAFPVALQANLPVEFWVKAGLQVALWLGVFYLNVYVIVPRILFKGKSLLFIFILLSLVASTTLISQLLNEYWDIAAKMEHALTLLPGSGGSGYNLINGLMQTAVSLLLLVAGTSLRAGNKVEVEQFSRESMEKEKVLAELSFLKAQINPHFFFNVLNSIYALTVSNVALAQDAIYTLSQMMRYVLRECRKNETTIGKEIDFIENYIKLMKLRLSEHTTIVFEKPAVYADLPVAPMLLLPFVENAFKHGASNYQQGVISIRILVEDQQLMLFVTNPILPRRAENLEESNGIGLANTQRRLDLLYTERYELHVGENRDAKVFSVILKIKLT